MSLYIICDVICTYHITFVLSPAFNFILPFRYYKLISPLNAFGKIYEKKKKIEYIKTGYGEIFLFRFCSAENAIYLLFYNIRKRKKNITRPRSSTLLFQRYRYI